MIHIAVYAAVFVAVVIIVLSSQFNIWTPESDSNSDGGDSDEGDTSQSTKVVIDQKRAFCQTVRFAMRLKRKMRRFKERKARKVD